MGFRRYVAPSAREALDRIRKELGPEAVILSNRRSSSTGRVEIIAAAPGEMRALVDDFIPAPALAERADAPPRTAGQRAPAPARSAAEPRRAVESFQEFIRRQAPRPAPRADAVAMYDAMAREPALDDADDSPAVFRRRPSRLDAPPAAASLPAAAERRAVAPAVAPRAMPAPVAPAFAAAAALVPAAAVPAAIAAPPAAAPSAPAAPIAAAPVASPMAPAPAAADTGVMAELQSLRSALTDRISLLEKQLVPKPAPAPVASAAPAPAGRSAADAALLALKRQSMTRLLMSGFSPELARRIADAIPATLDPKQSDAWLQACLAQQVRCPADADNLLYAGGATALVGPTGVGKTTTVAKLAARFVVRHGAASLGLVTLDSYRMGAHEQLRSYGRILGVPVQVAHDGNSLRDLLASMHGKRKVLIDTCGMSQRDARLAEMLAMLAEARFQEREVDRVLLVNAASHAETLDEVARAWGVQRARGAVLTKIDEAARIGGGLDALIRFQLPLLGLTNGQRVPEDWHPGNAGLLAHLALKPFGAAFCLDNSEVQSMSGAGVALV
jgi:flagellar biosynthesis protein FlhF